MYRKAFRKQLNVKGFFDTMSYRRKFAKEHPHFFNPCGTLVFSGAQGSGKTLSAVDYCTNILHEYPLCVICTNVELTEFPFNAYIGKNQDNGFCLYDVDGDIITPETIAVRYNSGDTDYRVCVEYTGLDCLKWINNGEYGVLYLIDEFHLELNSLESKNVDIEVMVEISQQRKQRKHIVGTSQVFMRLAKPLREQIKNVVDCQCLLGCFQYNKILDGEKSEEKDGKLVSKVVGRSFFFHTSDLYKAYDTYAKMHRYNKEWQGRKRVDSDELFRREFVPCQAF